MSDLRTAAQQALEALKAALSDDQPYIERCRSAEAALRAALAQEQAGAWQDGVLEGHLRKRERWLAQQPEPVQEPVESALQAVAEKIGDQCAVWYGIGARDVEEVLREAVRHGLVHGALAESETTCRRAICQRGPDGYCAPCHERMYP